MAAFVLNSIHRKHNTADKTDQKNITASQFVSFAKIKQELTESETMEQCPAFLPFPVLNNFNDHITPRS